MKLLKLLESWVTDIISSALGIALISFAFSIKSENPYYLIPLITGIILQIPTVYFQIWKYIKELLQNFGIEIE